MQCFMQTFAAHIFKEARLSINIRRLFKIFKNMSNLICNLSFSLRLKNFLMKQKLTKFCFWNVIKALYILS